VLPKVTLQGHILVPEIDMENVKRELVVHANLTNEELGCLKFEVTADANIANRFNVYEEFVNQAAFDSHQLRVKISTWGKVTKNVTRHYQISNGA